MSIDEVRSLVAERQRYDDWLTALDARRAEAPSRVFDRVRGDYVARRDAVITQLREHVGALSAHGDDLTSRLSALEAELATYEDRRIETMLRNAVGEYDDERWESERQDVEAQIATLGEQRSGVLAEIDEIRSLLANASSEPPVAEVEVSEEAVAEAVFVDMPVTAPMVETPVGRNADHSAESLESFAHVHVTFGATPDGLSDVRLVTEMPELVPAAEQASTEFDDALAMFTDTASTSDQTFPRSLGSIEVEVEVEADVPVDTGDTFDDLAFLRSVIDPTPASSSPSVSAVPNAVPTNEPLKTLRCTECGTMNLPTEWYCERCGGELAAF